MMLSSPRAATLGRPRTGADTKSTPTCRCWVTNSRANATEMVDMTTWMTPGFALANALEPSRTVPNRNIFRKHR